MTLHPGDNITWTNPDDGEIHDITIQAVECFGNIYTITTVKGEIFDAWGHEINNPKELVIDDEQINPNISGKEIRTGILR